MFRNLPDRVKFVKGKLRRRYRKLLEMPNWTQEELQPLGYRMRQFVVSALAKRESVKQRIAWSPARFADDISAVFDLFKRIAANDASRSPTGDEELQEKPFNDNAPQPGGHREG